MPGFWTPAPSNREIWRNIDAVFKVISRNADVFLGPTFEAGAFFGRERSHRFAWHSEDQ